MENYLEQSGDRTKADICGKSHVFYENILLEEMGISAQSVNILKKAGLHTAADILGSNIQDLMAMEDLHTDDIVEILEQLEKIGKV